jgi:A/G-specific adenine glycosylase
MSGFARQLVAWQQRHGRSGMPWQGERDPYRVWLSEIMLQQTQVATVVGYYTRFLARFPTVAALAQAPLDEVMPLWAGLGYYARARNLHACAVAVVQHHGGSFPRSAAELATLPGIGRSTAAAIAAFCFDERASILDGNVKRVLTRHFGIDGDPAQASTERVLWAQAGALLPERAAQMPVYTQAVMDLGATVCTRRQPLCERCPLHDSCVARRDGRVDALPTPRVRKPAPLRRALMLVALHQGEVLLEQRPPAGLWGGLLVLPQFESDQALHAAVRDLGPAARRAVPTPMAPRRHAFTHFTLEFVPQVLRLPRRPTVAGESVARWVRLDALESLALPAPLRTLLRELRDGEAGR